MLITSRVVQGHLGKMAAWRPSWIPYRLTRGGVFLMILESFNLLPPDFPLEFYYIDNQAAIFISMKNVYNICSGPCKARRGLCSGNPVHITAYACPCLDCPQALPRPCPGLVQALPRPCPRPWRLCKGGGRQHLTSLPVGDRVRLRGVMIFSFFTFFGLGDFYEFSAVFDEFSAVFQNKWVGIYI